jgi:hypothetical protein
MQGRDRSRASTIPSRASAATGSNRRSSPDRRAITGQPGQRWSGLVAGAMASSGYRAGRQSSAGRGPVGLTPLRQQGSSTPTDRADAGAVATDPATQPGARPELYGSTIFQ